MTRAPGFLVLVGWVLSSVVSACSEAGTTDTRSDGGVHGDSSVDARAGEGSSSGSGGNTSSGSGGTSRSSGGAPSTGGSGAGGRSAGGTSSGAGGARSGTGGAGGAPPSGDYPCRANGDGKTTAVFVNHCAEPLHVRGSDIEGATVAAGDIACRDLGTATETLSAKRYWGYLADDPGAEHYTLAEFTFNTDFNDFDWYNISHVDAHNLTMQIVPLDRPKCSTLTCSDPALLTDCPAVGRFTNQSGDLIACVSPNRNDGNSEVALHFESCDDAYAWSGDDANGSDPSPVKACAGEDFAIVFCP